MLTANQRFDLSVLSNNGGGIFIYSPTQDSLNRYGPLQDLGLVRIRDIGSDEAQETILKVTLTTAGRAALKE